ncbi:pts system mannose-specific iia component [Liquorilactobacillus aquaticus DSM 21051]|uniref:Pts system mannose-specific iia component n=1 Tax=Liquorilactobacillus aquaticus DSM 21051 TaxID=1423725 RepID=A0A0R2CVQ8_9LACO|nr:mannose/fructose/sorbose PTS transporter subunit IIA [Liquorilactobacillus aquaticus]KRM95298.1 pts system mannose-specific iia component [Liquorilactobacillus aquaticus DSM 21051]
MVKLIISGHGEISTGIVSAVNMIFGENDNVVAVPFKKGEGLEDIKEHYETTLKKFPAESEFLFLVDLFGGSPYNAAIQLAYGNENIDIATGVNLPMVLEALGMVETNSLREIIRHLKEAVPESFKIFSEQTQKLTDQEDNEEDDLL